MLGSFLYDSNMGKHKHEDFKKAAVEYYLEGSDNLDEVSEVFKAPRRSLKRWLSRYLEENNRIQNKNLEKNLIT
jgi:transposase-like protein